MDIIDNWVTLLKLRESEFDGIEYSTLQEKYILLLATRVSELCLDTVLLLNQKRISSAPIILRTALESYADLLSCIKDPTHYKEMTESLYWQLHEVSKNYDLEKSNHYKSLGKYSPVNKRFKKAELSELFNGYYKALSLHSHGNLSALIEFHSTDNETYMGTMADDEKIIMYFEQATNLLALSLKDTLSFFDKSKHAIDYAQKTMEQINKTHNKALN
ncbi:DUF5677 domain-containing protein [Vibrio crassostreae]|uniref:DUF5677 domain-containing protein n=1 Tax=Vibrio crassostreae TaxID=246167 RepID=UPI00104C1539|nr:DUF5677 domain-containing protein [Vibrio crassostreae]TCO00228.1 hypothetical protein EDB51_1093 [Vibrio crassostreae]CAK2117740.1 conserved hypothetical protein [Vibrio crassostreae]CAK2121353.1 conserved hypothetical protein [Vibrio crassostreae]CAK2130941.1 conserved hypothetical protein [Vibrio crassostreae]CAK2973583.1 conserved hypothetical protein [Vibrio crassostreae]